MAKFKPNFDGRYVNVIGDTMTGDLNMTADILPTDNGVYDLGSPTANWARIDGIDIDGITIFALSILGVGTQVPGDSIIFSENQVGKPATGTQGTIDVNTSVIGGDTDLVIDVNNAILPITDGSIDIGGPTPLYFANAYIDKLYLNATATLDGATAGHIKFVGDLVPATDDTEWVGEIGSPFKAIKGLVIKDTTDGKHYKIEVISGTLTATALD